MPKQPFLKQFSLHLVGWVLFYAFLYSLRNKDGTDANMLYPFFVLSFASALASYTHFLLFKLFFEKRKHKNYVIYLVISLVCLSFLNQIITNLFVALSFVSSLISLVFVHIFSAAFYFAKNGITKQVQMQELKAKQLEAEMKLLKAQINPHFLFNTLNNLYGLVLQNQTQQASRIILKLSDLMRYVLESSKAEQVSLKKEIQFLEDYLALEKIRLAQQASIHLEIAGLEKDVLIAPLLFIPLVENAFKHGLQTINNDSFAHFSLSVQGSEVYFEAQNSVGKPLAYQAESGTGLGNLRKRLEMMYPQKHVLEIEQKAFIFRVTLQIHL